MTAEGPEAATTSAPQPLLELGRPGDGAAGVRAAALYDEHGRMVLGVCRMLLRNPHDAEDAAQQTFLSAYRSLLAGAQPRRPAAWLATIARHECLGRIRARMREPLPDTAEAVSELPDPLAAAVRRADLEALWRAIGALPPQQREALLLREFSGLTYGELAAALAVSEPAVESLLFRARRELRLRLRALAPAGLAPAAAVRAALDWTSSLPVAAKVAAGAAAVGLVAGGTVVGVDPKLVRPGDASQVRASAARPMPLRRPAAWVTAARAPAPAPRRAGGGAGQAAQPVVFAAAPLARSGGDRAPAATTGTGTGSGRAEQDAPTSGAGPGGGGSAPSEPGPDSPAAGPTEGGTAGGGSTSSPDGGTTSGGRDDGSGSASGPEGGDSPSAPASGDPPEASSDGPGSDGSSGGESTASGGDGSSSGSGEGSGSGSTGGGDLPEGSGSGSGSESGSGSG